MEGCISVEFVGSNNLINAAHKDTQDLSYGIATWVEHIPNMATGWYFILPNVTADNKTAIVIKLYHGLSLLFDGRVIWHCSTVEKTGVSNSVNGYFLELNET